MAEVPEFLVMAKAVGARCNLRCAYCYYLDKETITGRSPARMERPVLERYIRGRLQGARTSTMHFEWHGGEPTLAGLDFFKTAVELERRYARPGCAVTNGLQTNGLLIDDEWAAFLGAAGFSVGLSLDGPQALHDTVRRTASGEPTQERVVRAFRLLRGQGVFVNILCVLSQANVGEPDAIYDFFRSIDAGYIQFLPLVTRTNETEVSELTPPPSAAGDFLCRIFDRWLAEDADRMVVQAFDEALRPLCGLGHSLCVPRPVCGDVLDFCHGGCLKDRFVSVPGEEQPLNYLCPSYRLFFRHCRPELTRLAEHLKAGKPLTDFRAARTT